MKLTAKQLRKMIKEEIAKEAAFDRVKGYLGVGPKKGSKEYVRAQIKKVNELAIKLNAAVGEIRDMAMQTGDLQQNLDQDLKFEAETIEALDVMLQNTKKAVKMSADLAGKGHELERIGSSMSPI